MMVAAAHLRRGHRVLSFPPVMDLALRRDDREYNSATRDRLLLYPATYEFVYADPRAGLPGHLWVGLSNTHSVSYLIARPSDLVEVAP